MHILFLTNYYPPFEIGGYEQLCRDVAECLAQRGHTYTVLTSNHGIDANVNLSEPNVFRLLRIQPNPEARLGIAGQFILTRRRFEKLCRSTFRQIVQEVCPDVVFVWNLQGLPQKLAIDAENLPDIAVAYWLAGYTPAEPDLFWRYWVQAPGKRNFLAYPKRMLGRLALAQLRREDHPIRPQMLHVAVVSEYMRQKGVSENTLPSHAEVIYNGVEVDEFFRLVPQPDSCPPFNLLLAGRLSEDKGCHVALQAISRLVDFRPQRDFCLLVVGSGPENYVSRLKRFVIDHDLAEQVKFYGWLKREHVPLFMHNCQILLLPTVHPEPFARVTIEAMAAGLAVVGTLTGGTGEILKHGINGLAFTQGNSDELAQHINRLLNEPQLRYRLALEGQATVVSNYTLDHMMNKVEALLERAVSENGAGRRKSG